MTTASAGKTPPFSCLAHLQCARCGKSHVSDSQAHLCSCGSPLLACYDLQLAAQTFSPNNLRRRPRSLWRYHELLPVRDETHIISLGENVTPVLALKHLGAAIGFKQLFMKDEGLLPTGSFKARGAAVGVSRARELGVKAFAMPTNGNAGAAWSLYGAKARMQAHIVMPVQAPAAARHACVSAGARVHAVNGLIDDAGRIVAKAVQKFALYDASTFKEPYRVEGKKTLGFEIAEQFDWSLPEVIIYPTGGGVGLVGMHKAFGELHALRLIPRGMPRFYAVQAAGCAPIVRAWQQGQASATYWQNARTVAFGINVPKTLADFLILEILRQCSGGAIAVADEQCLQCQAELAREEGLLVSPEGGATFAAATALLRKGIIHPDERVLLINTGSGLSSNGGMQASVPVLEPNDEITNPAAL